MLSHTLQPLRQDKAYYRRAGNYIARIAEEKDYILTYDAWTMHYAKASNPNVKISRKLPNKLTRKNLLRQIELKSATIVVIRNKLSKRNTDNISTLLTESPFVELHRFKQAVPEHHDFITVYRIDHDALNKKR